MKINKGLLSISIDFLKYQCRDETHPGGKEILDLFPIRIDPGILIEGPRETFEMTTRKERDKRIKTKES